MHYSKPIFAHKKIHQKFMISFLAEELDNILMMVNVHLFIILLAIFMRTAYWTRIIVLFLIP
jgi:hypothetical protein